MSFCKFALLYNIVVIVSKATDFCISGPGPTETAYCGEYENTGQMYNGENVYALIIGNQCKNYKLYRSNNVWYIGETLGGSYTARCTSETILPSDCREFERNTILNGVSVTIGPCPVFGCSNFRVTGSGRPDCDGVYTRCDANIYRGSCDPNDSRYNSKNWAFSNKRGEFYCTNTDARTDCSISGIASQQKNTEFLVMNDGDSRFVTLRSYFSSGYQDKNALFECGVQVTPSPTSNPVAPVTDTDICLCDPHGYYLSNGQYYHQNIQFNGKPTYKMTSKYDGSEYYIYYVISGTNGHWLIRGGIQRPINEINYVSPYLGIQNEQDPVIAVGSHASYGSCICDKIIFWSI